MTSADDIHEPDPDEARPRVRADDGTIGVVAVPRHRPKLFQTTINITPGSLPRRTPRFAFLDTRR